MKQAAFSACTRLHCTRTTKPYGFRKGRLYFNTVFQHRTTERSHKNKAALLTKMPRSLWPVEAPEPQPGSPAPGRFDRPLVVSEAAPCSRRATGHCLRSPISQCPGATGLNEKKGAALPPPPRQRPAARRGASRVLPPTWVELGPYRFSPRGTAAPSQEQPAETALQH